MNQNRALEIRPDAALKPADETLSDGARERIRDSVPESTRRVYSGDWARFTQWCADADRTALPATTQTLGEYANHLADASRAPSTIERALAAISTAHHAAGHTRPDLRAARRVLRRYRRQRAEAGSNVRKAAPVTVDTLRALVAVLDQATMVGLRDRALLVLGFALGARRSEIAALSLADLAETDEGLEVTIRTSKTDHDSAGRVVAVPYGTHPDTCPVRTVRAWVAVLAAAGRKTGPLFVRIDRHGTLGRAPTGRGAADGRLTGQAVALVVNRTAIRAGLDSAAAWSGHSLRRGFATEAYRHGANRLRIARHGGWDDNSRALAGYIEDVDRWKDNPLRGMGL